MIVRSIVISVILYSGLSLYAGSLNLIQRDIHESLVSDSGWKYWESVEEYSVSTKIIPDQDLVAVSVSGTSSIQPEIIQRIVYDIASYPRVLKSSPDIISKEITHERGMKVGYQYLAIDFPFFSDRHYLFEIKKPNLEDGQNPLLIRWELIDQMEKYSNYFVPCEDGCVYLDLGVGIWKVSAMDDGRYQYSYRLFMDPGGTIPNFIIDQINSLSVVNIFSDVMNEAGRRSR